VADTCPNCNATVATGTRFCGSCGTNLAIAQAAAPPPPPQPTVSAPPPPPPPPFDPPPVASANGAGGAPPAAVPLNKEAAQGFLSSLLDYRFRNFITTKVIPVLYVLLMIMLAGEYLFGAMAGLSLTPGLGLLWLIVFGPIAVLFQLIVFRVALEIAIVFFRIREDTDDIRGTVARHADTAPLVAAQV